VEHCNKNHETNETHMFTFYFTNCANANAEKKRTNFEEK
jgi:hypothetical protein